MNESSIIQFDSQYEILPVIDAHTHIFPDNIAEKARDNVSKYYGAPMYTCGKVSELYRVRGGVYKNRSVVMQLVCSPAITPSQTESINTFIASVCEKDDSLIGFGTLHRDNENYKSEISRMKMLGLKGIKFHPDFQRTNMDDPKLIEIYKEAARAKLPVLFHMGDRVMKYSTADKLRNVLDAVPELIVIAARMGGYMHWKDAFDIIPVCDRVYYDISSTLSFVPPEGIRKMLRKFGTDRIFFGSDFPICNPTDELKKLDEIGLNDIDRRRIECYNFIDFLNKVIEGEQKNNEGTKQKNGGFYRLGNTSYDQNIK